MAIKSTGKGAAQIAAVIISLGGVSAGVYYASGPLYELFTNAKDSIKNGLSDMSLDQLSSVANDVLSSIQTTGSNSSAQGTETKTTSSQPSTPSSGSSTPTQKSASTTLDLTSIDLSSIFSSSSSGSTGSSSSSPGDSTIVKFFTQLKSQISDTNIKKSVDAAINAVKEITSTS